ncbi:hypothetical protein ABIA48_004748 [Pseudomonas sp. S30_BP2TU TE3576]
MWERACSRRGRNYWPQSPFGNSITNLVHPFSHRGMHSKCGSELARDEAGTAGLSLLLVTQSQTWSTHSPTGECIPNVGAGLLAKGPVLPASVSFWQLNHKPGPPILPQGNAFQMWERACSRRGRYCRPQSPLGNSITNRVHPFSDSQRICPPWARMIDRVIANPNPACSLLPSRRAGSAR